MSIPSVVSFYLKLVDGYSKKIVASSRDGNSIQLFETDDTMPSTSSDPPFADVSNVNTLPRRKTQNSRVTQNNTSSVPDREASQN